MFENDVEDIKRDIQLYNTKKVVLHDSEYLEINAVNDLIPVIYYFKNDFNPDELVKIISDVKSLCESLQIEYLSLDGDE